jgi:hypothetical protein
MRLLIGPTGRSVEVDQSTLLGKGGEKVVHRDPDHPNSRAVAVYHKPTKRRAEKVEAFLQRQDVLPEGIISPLEVALRGSKPVGFGMHQLSRKFRNLKEIFTPSFVKDFGITTKVIADTFINIGENLQTIHPLGMVVGDLNDGGLMIHTEDHRIAWVDVDSWSIDTYPCIVGTQLYLVPDLYGIKLDTGNYFEPWMDWYSYSVLLTRGLLRKHPFKAGKHAQFKNVIERARNGKTIFDSDVTFPTAGLQAEMLTDELLDPLIKHLKREQRGEFPLDALRTYRDQLTGCPSCGLWYPGTRDHCPGCAEKTAVQIKTMYGVSAEELIETQGRILHVQLDKRTIYCVAEENGNLMLYRKEPEAHVVRNDVGLAFQSGMRFGIFAGTLVICADDNEDEDVGALYLLEVTPQGPRPVTTTTTSVLAGKAPVFATSRRFLYRIANGILLREERFGADDLLPRPVTTVFPGQCWFTVDPNPGADHETVFGLNRDVSQETWFVAYGDHDGQNFQRQDVAIPPLEDGESMKDLSVRFHQDRVLVMRRTLLGGVERVRIEIVHARTGDVMQSEIFDPNDKSQWDSIHGKGFAGNTVMHATDDGLVAESLQRQTAQPLAGSAAVVSSGDSILPYGSDILAVHHFKVSLISKQ